MPGKRWTSAELTALTEQLRKNGGNSRGVSLANRPSSGICAQVRRKRLVALKPSRVKWPLSQRRLLKRFWRDGLKPDDIYDRALLGVPHRSLWAIKKKWGRMRLSNRKRARQMSRKKIWQPGERELFIAYLLRWSATMTPEQIGIEWGLGRSTVCRYQTEHGVKESRKSVMAMAYSLAKQPRARRRIRRGNIRRWNKWRAEREQQLLDRAKVLGRRNGVMHRICNRCDRSWPLKKTFWHYNEKREKWGSSRYFKRRCRLCQNEIIRQKSERQRRKRKREAQAVTSSI